MIQHSKKEEDAMLNKGVKKVLAVALLSVIGLAACSKDIQAKPKDYENKLLTFSNNDEVYHNAVKYIEDAYRDGALASAVLDEVLYQYSVSVFGRYNRVAEPFNLGSDEITLKEAYIDSIRNDYVDGENTTARKFINSHKAYWSTTNEKDKDGNPVRDTSAQGKANELLRLQAKWNAIEERIARKLYEDISGGSYDNNRKYFSEKKYLASLRSQLKKVANPYDNATVMYEESDKIVITPDVKEEDVFKATGYLHRDNYQDPKSYDEHSATESRTGENAVTITYVEDDIIPAIYRNLLVEQYLFDEAYNNLGRSYARKVNVLTISTNNNNDKAANYLMQYFVREKIAKQEVTLADFNAVSAAYKGVTAEAQAYLANVNTAYPGAFPKEQLTYKGTTYDYYVGTDFGDMMTEFGKIKDDINTSDATSESDFTGGYTYTADVGKEIKENGIRKNDYVTDGWYIKDGGLSDLPDDIKTRLFNIGVANVVDSDQAERTPDAQGHQVPAPEESKLVAKINGKYYLKVASKEASADAEEDILFYENGKYYVIQIEEAVSSSKLDKKSTKYADVNKDAEAIKNEVARVIGSNEKYQTLSTKHWLEQAKIKYHDSKVYDYFKENYPDLFEDD